MKILSPRFTENVRRLICLIGAILALQPCVVDASEWYKGNLHAHSSWSDGRELPELAAYWYKSHGYNFFAATDHNTTWDGTIWKTVGSTYVPTASVTRAEELFGPGWNELTGSGANQTVRLKTSSEVGAKLGEANKFLIINSEEISSTVTVGGSGKFIHVNAWNLTQPIAAAVGTSVTTVLNQNLASVAAQAAQAAQTNRTVLAQINHPNATGYAISPEDCAQSSAQFVEVFNMIPDATFSGDATHPGIERSWDIANTIRAGTMKTSLLYGTATDDAHIYNTTSSADPNPGRGFVMVRADTLSANAVLDAMARGDFYFSTGVTLKDVVCSDHTLNVEIEAETGVTYRTDFVGTLVGTDPTRNPDGTYSAEIGKVLKRVYGASASYTMTGDELYVRAVTYSSKVMDNPSNGSGMEQAWTQPVRPMPEPGTCAMLATGLSTLVGYAWRKCK